MKTLLSAWCILGLSGHLFAATPPVPEMPDTANPEPTALADDSQPELEQPEHQQGGNPVVVLKTSKGDIKIELFPEEAPLSVENFLSYVSKGHYNGTIFHRVIDGFMIQGGGFTRDMQQKPTDAPIKNEAQNGLKNDRGTLAMARTMIVDSATSQFFINVVDNDFLNFKSPDQRGFGYCVFGKVIEGMEVVDAIKGVPTGNHMGQQNVPTEPIEILEAVRVD